MELALEVGCPHRGRHGAVSRGCETPHSASGSRVHPELLHAQSLMAIPQMLCIYLGMCVMRAVNTGTTGCPGDRELDFMILIAPADGLNFVRPGP